MSNIKATNLDKIEKYLNDIVKFEASTIEYKKLLKQTKDKKYKQKIRYNDLMIKHCNEMIDLYRESKTEVSFNHNYE